MSVIANNIVNYFDQSVSYKKSDVMDDLCNHEAKDDDLSPNNDSIISTCGLDSSQEEDLTTTPENKYFVVHGSTPLTLIFKRYSISDTTTNNCVVRTFESVQNEIYFTKNEVPSSSDSVNVCYTEPVQTIEGQDVEMFNQHPVDSFSSPAFRLAKSCVSDTTSNIELLSQTSIINCESTFQTSPVLENEVSITNLNLVSESEQENLSHSIPNVEQQQSENNLPLSFNTPFHERNVHLLGNTSLLDSNVSVTNRCINVNLVSGSEQENVPQSIQCVEQQLCRNNVPLSANTPFQEGNLQILGNSINTVCDYAGENGSNFISVNATSTLPPTIIHGNGCSDNVYFITSEGQNNFEVRNNSETNLVQLLYSSSPAIRNVYQPPYQIILTNETQVSGIVESNTSENELDIHNDRNNSQQVEFINNTGMPQGNEMYFSGKRNESEGLIPNISPNFVNEMVTSSDVISSLKYDTNVLPQSVNVYSNESSIRNLSSLNQCSAQYNMKNENLVHMFSASDEKTALESHKMFPVETNPTVLVTPSDSLLQVVTAPFECQQTIGSPMSVYYVSQVQDCVNSTDKPLVKNNTLYSSCTNVDVDSGYSEGCSAVELWNANAEVGQNFLSSQVTLNTKIDETNEQILDLTSQSSKNQLNISECETVDTVATKCNSLKINEVVSNQICVDSQGNIENEELSENNINTSSKPFLNTATLSSDFNCQFQKELSPMNLTLQSTSWDNKCSPSMTKVSTGMDCSMPITKASLDVNCTLNSVSSVTSPHLHKSLPLPLSEASAVLNQSIPSTSIETSIFNCLLPAAPSETVQISNNFISNSVLNTNNESMTESTNSLFETTVSTNASYIEHSPLLFTSEDESEDTIKQKSYATPRGKENTPRKRDKLSSCPKILASTRKRFEHIQELLSGIPPPPKITMPPYSVSDMLQLIKENENLFWNKPLGGTEESNINIKSKPMLQNVNNICWPEIKNVDYFSIHYNHGTLSEDLDMQYQKWQERYVARETASSCNIWFTSSVSGSSNNKKRRPIGQSPGRRLSHLARRRQSFSCNSLQNSVAGKLPGNLHNTALERRLIMVEIKKTEKQQKIMGQSNTSIERNSVGKNNLLNSSRLSSSRRALFQSPNDDEKCRETRRPRSTSKNMDQVRRNLLRHTIGGCDDAENYKSLTDNEINVNGKRLREEELMPPRKFSRRLNFNDSPLKGSGHSPARRYSTNSISSVPSLRNTEMSSLVSVSQPAQNIKSRIDSTLRKKLLWAVAEALKKEGITLQHHLFRACASSLTAVLKQSLSGPATEMKTSDQMLKIARLHVTEIVTKVKAKLPQV